MNTRQWIFAVVFLLSSAVFLYGVHTFDDGIKMVSKPIPVVILIIETLLHTGRFCRLTTLGLVFSVVGDVFIEYSPKTFIYGLVAFLFAHIVFSVAFLLETKRLSLWKTFFYLLEGSGVFWICQGGMGSLKIPVIVYIAFLTLMGGSAATLLEVTRKHNTTWQRWAPVVGASFFVLSDSLIALKKFHYTSAAHELHFFTITTYWVAQSLITWGAITLKFDSAAAVAGKVVANGVASGVASGKKTN